MKTKTELGSRLTGALAILGLLAGGLAFTDTALARTSQWLQVCSDAWDDSPADDPVAAEFRHSRDQGEPRCEGEQGST